jgi:hypothetical protein
MKTLPPFPVSCLTPVRWRNNNCSDAAVAPGDLVTDFGVEYDWVSLLRQHAGREHDLDGRPLVPPARGRALPMTTAGGHSLVHDEGSALG